jgi:hypothetical protein
MGAVAASAALAGCGSSPAAPDGNAPARGTLASLLARPGADIALLPGTQSFVPGRIRFSFLVIRHDGSVVERPTARVWISRGLEEKPYQQARAALERIGVPGKSEATAAHATEIYVTHLNAPRPGKYWVLAEPVGAGRPVQAIGNVIVARRSSEPAVGAAAIASRTPTIESTNGDLARLTTATPPDRALLRHSVAQSLAARKPFVVVFATPKLCTSRTCGPVVDVVDAVRRRFARTDIRFIHVEIYENNDPTRGYNQWVKEWRLPSEPWTFLVGRDGRIKAKFEGSVSVRELAAAVRRRLVHA